MGEKSGAPVAFLPAESTRRPRLLDGREPSGQTLEDLYRHLYSPLVTRAIWRFRLSREDARDVVQDAFALAVTKVDLTSNPQAWLVRVVDYISMNACRKAKRRKELLFRWGLGDSVSPEFLGRHQPRVE